MSIGTGILKNPAWRRPILPCPCLDAAETVFIDYLEFLPRYRNIFVCVKAPPLPWVCQTLYYCVLQLKWYGYVLYRSNINFLFNKEDFFFLSRPLDNRQPAQHCVAWFSPPPPKKKSWLRAWLFVAGLDCEQNVFTCYENVPWTSLSHCHVSNLLFCCEE